MDSRNGTISISRAQFGKCGAKQLQTNRGEASIPMAMPKVPPNSRMIHRVTVSRYDKSNNQDRKRQDFNFNTKPTMRTSQNFLIDQTHGIAASHHRSVLDSRGQPNYGNTRRTMSTAQAYREQRPVFAGYNGGQRRIDAIQRTHPIVQHAKNKISIVGGQFHERQNQQHTGQNIVQPKNIKSAQQMIAKHSASDIMFENGPMKFSITVDGQEFDITMKPTEILDPDLECQTCKKLFFSSDERMYHETIEHPDKKRAVQTIIVFNPMMFHALHPPTFSELEN